MQTARRLVKGPDTAETSERRLACRSPSTDLENLPKTPNDSR